ncbi:unnamed protein product [Caenorhabditis auriculariae]|uniref:MARVEL domain-containing protein n=1 Tax=Caenorhabditis auriculariae TaxID=2777116 RepID=A0A8S1H7Z3_9PELO|nr:unnamed protein product [Caenorhabditis auriculariae]
MSYGQMKEMPHILKPALLLLTLLQIIFMASPGLRGFGWFVCLTSILEFIVAIAVVAAFFVHISIIDHSYYNLGELGYSAVFAVCSVLNTVYYFCNIFYHFNFWFLLATAVSVFLVLAYGLQALVCFNNRNISSSGGGGSNQATAAPPPSFPAGVNPA